MSEKRNKKKGTESKRSTCKKLLKKAAQGAVVLGTLNIGLTAYASEEDVINSNARDMAARGIVDRDYGRTLENNPAEAMGKHPDQLTREDQAAIAGAQQRIKNSHTSEDTWDGRCGISRPSSAPATRW